MEIDIGNYLKYGGTIYLGKIMLEKLNKQIEKLEVKKQKILTDIKESNVASVDSIIKAGKELELIRLKIWTIEEAIHS